MKRLGILVLTIVLLLVVISLFRQDNEPPLEFGELTTETTKIEALAQPRVASLTQSGSSEKAATPPLVKQPASNEPPDDERVCLIPLSKRFCMASLEDVPERVAAASSDIRNDHLRGVMVLVNFLYQCNRVPRSEEELFYAIWNHHVLDQTVYGAFPDSQLRQNRGDGFRIVTAKRYQIFGEHYEQRLETCEPVFRLIDGGFREEVTRLAEQGNEAAQFLFALWPPSGAVDFQEHLQWQLKARAYSEESVRKGMPMGQAALSNSYLGGLFSPYQFIMAWAHAIAAKTCGAEEELLPHAFKEIDGQSPSQFVHGLLSENSTVVWAEALAKSCR